MDVYDDLAADHQVCKHVSGKPVPGKQVRFRYLLGYMLGLGYVPGTALEHLPYWLVAGVCSGKCCGKERCHKTTNI